MQLANTGISRFFDKLQTDASQQNSKATFAINGGRGRDREHVRAVVDELVYDEQKDLFCKICRCEFHNGASSTRKISDLLAGAC